MVFIEGFNPPPKEPVIEILPVGGVVADIPKLLDPIPTEESPKPWEDAMYEGWTDPCIGC